MKKIKIAKIKFPKELTISGLLIEVKKYESKNKKKKKKRR